MAARLLASEVTFLLQLQWSAKALVSVAGMTLCTPKYERKLVSSLDLTVSRNTRLVITGPSGCGKTSLLRAIAGLWTSGTGCITRPPLERLTGQPGGDGMLFIPQKPYMVLGSLRQQLLYPVYDSAIISEALANFDEEDGQGNLLDPQSAPILLTSNGAESENGNSRPPASDENGATKRPSDDELCDTLRLVGLASLLERDVKDGDTRGPLDVLAQWSSVLSLGEQQRLAFARLLLAKPALALLDESTSALDLNNEARLYNLLQEQGIAYVSVGHRSSLMQFHDTVLKLGIDSDSSDDTLWEVADAKSIAGMAES